MTKYIVGAIGLLIVIGGGYYLLRGTKSAAPTPPGSGNSASVQVATSSYATSTFSVVYPSDYTADDSYTYTAVNPSKPISGVKFTIPMAIATGTNLSADTYVSVEELPRAKNCTGDIYLAANVAPRMQTDNGVEYSVASSSGAGAGNFYDETVYALAGSQPCTAVRYYIHSTNIGNYSPGAVNEFNRDALLNAFDTIRRSLRLTP